VARLESELRQLRSGVAEQDRFKLAQARVEDLNAFYAASSAWTVPTNSHVSLSVRKKETQEQGAEAYETDGAHRLHDLPLDESRAHAAVARSTPPPRPPPPAAASAHYHSDNSSSPAHATATEVASPAMPPVVADLRRKTTPTLRGPARSPALGPPKRVAKGVFRWFTSPPATTATAATTPTPTPTLARGTPQAPSANGSAVSGGTPHQARWLGDDTVRVTPGGTEPRAASPHSSTPSTSTPSTSTPSTLAPAPFVSRALFHNPSPGVVVRLSEAAKATVDGGLTRAARHASPLRRRVLFHRQRGGDHADAVEAAPPTTADGGASPPVERAYEYGATSYAQDQGVQLRVGSATTFAGAAAKPVVVPNVMTAASAAEGLADPYPLPAAASPVPTAHPVLPTQW